MHRNDACYSKMDFHCHPGLEATRWLLGWPWPLGPLISTSAQTCRMRGPVVYNQQDDLAQRSSIHASSHDCLSPAHGFISRVVHPTRMSSAQHEGAHYALRKRTSKPPFSCSKLGSATPPQRVDGSFWIMTLESRHVINRCGEKADRLRLG